jgi:hypothetical protein
VSEEPGSGPGWSRLAGVVAQELPASEVDAVWVFPVLRQQQREWGTAVISRVDGDRRRIYTARYSLMIKGKERGKFESTIAEVGSGPVDALQALLQEVHHRTDDEVPPIPVPLELWFPPEAPAVGQS